jgi:hypothetical protein
MSSLPPADLPRARPPVNMTVEEWHALLRSRIEELQERVNLLATSDKAMVERRIKWMWDGYASLHNVIHNFVATKQEQC